MSWQNASTDKVAIFSQFIPQNIVRYATNQYTTKTWSCQNATLALYLPYMQIIISKHARERMKERKISKEIVSAALAYPEQVAFDKTARNRYIAKKVYQPTTKTRAYLLLIIYERTPDEIKVITVISTSKINKYL